MSFESPSNDKRKNLNNNNDAGKITNNFGGMVSLKHIVLWLTVSPLLFH
jgi:hypothetical protein